MRIVRASAPINTKKHLTDPGLSEIRDDATRLCLGMNAKLALTTDNGILRSDSVSHTSGREISGRMIHPPRLPVWHVAALVTAAIALIPTGMEAKVGLQPSALPAPLSQLYQEPSAVTPLTWRGQTLFHSRATKGLVELSSPFTDRKVVVDSTSAHYTPQAAGFPSGPTITMPLDTYLDLGHSLTFQRHWTETVRADFTRDAARQQRKGTSRLEWRVPLPAPAPLRRFIGQEGQLKINGKHTATIGGKSQWTAGEVRTLAGGPSKFPALTMDQESQFTVEGKVGEAINIRITQDTQELGTSFRDQLANQIKLDYKGDEDAVFQEVQAGNTTLALPSTRFVGFNQQHKGLFGVRARGRLGPFGFTTIASHEKSESRRSTFRGGAKVDTVTLRDYEYIPRTYFFLDPVYGERLEDYRQVIQANPRDFNPADVIDERSLEVYINDFNVNNDPEQLAKPGIALVDAEYTANRVNGTWGQHQIIEASGFLERGTWHRLDPDDDYGLVAELGYIILRRPVAERHALAVRYRTVGNASVPGEQFGAASSDSLQLKLIQPRDSRPNFPTWDLEWRNVYRITKSFARGKKFEEDKIRVQVLKEVAGREPQASQDGKRYLQILGIDEHGQDPGTPPDQIIDADYIGLDGQRGVLIFPARKPFAPVEGAPGFGELQDRVEEIYTSQQDRDKIEASKYLVQVVNSSGQQRINLTKGRLAGVDPESVDVRLNGKSLQRGKDFRVSFNGEVTFMGQAESSVSDPGAELEITFESEDLIGIGGQQKTLIGMRTEYEFWEGDGSIGATVLYNNERSSDKRVRVGQEPARTVVWDTDLRANFEAPLLTRMVDALPLLKTAATSKVTVQAEIAQSRPNLNTRGQGYIDDFEGSERPEILSMFRTRWTPASIPEDLALDETNRGRMIWYNPINKVSRLEIWPQQEGQIDSRNNDVDILVMDQQTGDPLEPSWEGLMTSWTGGVRDFSQAKFLEVWLRGDEGILQIDLGDISEDYTRRELDEGDMAVLSLEEKLDKLRTGDRRLDTEDKPLPGRISGDGVASVEEDIGIDGRTDEQELIFYLALADADTSGSLADRRQRFRSITEYAGRNVEDPEGDNWDFDERNYDRINGTQGSGRSETQRPDSEDINNDGIVNTANNYFHHTIDLANDEHLPGTRSNAGWRLFRRPLFDGAVERIGSPDSSRIESARILLVTDAASLAETARLEIVQLEIIGNDWQENDIFTFGQETDVTADTEEMFNVAIIGTDENADYQPPPGIKLRKVGSSRTREREQSLVLDYESLLPQHQASASKVLSKNTDYTKYTRLRMFAHGDTADVSYVKSDTTSDIELFLRFGRDSANYYEFATPVFPKWDRRNWIDIDLLTMSQLKAQLQRQPELDSLSTVIRDPSVRDGLPAVYLVRGNPSMQQIKQLTIGVRNTSEIHSYSGEVYTDELRLDEARNDPGLAAFVRVNSSLADFMNVDASVDWQSQDFRTLANTARKSEDMRSNLTTTTNVHRFLPGSWGFSIPVKTTLSRKVSLPRFGPNSDVELLSNERDSLRTQTTKQFYEVSMSKRKGRAWYTRWTIDQMNVRMSTTSERGRSPVVERSSKDITTGSFKYQMPFPKTSKRFLEWLPDYMPKGMRQAKLKYFPSNLSYTMSANKTEEFSKRTTDPTPTMRDAFSLKETYTSKFNPLSIIAGDYSLQVTRDLRKKYDPRRLSFGREVKRNQKAGLKITPRLISWFDQNYSFQATYEENSDPRNRRATSVADSVTGSIVRTRDVTTKNELNGRWNLKLPTLLKAIGKPAGKKGAAPKRKEGRDRKPLFLRRFVFFSAAYVDPLSTTWRRSVNSSSFNLAGRPTFMYQIGLEDKLSVSRAGAGLTKQDSRRRGTISETGSGLKLPMGFSVKTSHKRNFTKRSGSTQTRLRVEEERSFPRITVNWGRANRLPLLNRFLNSAQVNVDFKKSESKQGEGSIRPQNLLQRSENREFSGSWTGQWRWGPATTIRSSRSTGEDTDFELAIIDAAEGEELDVTPQVRGRGLTERNSHSFEVKHNLRPRSLPLLGQLRSKVDLRLKFELEDEVRSSGTGNEVQAPISITERWRFEIKADYKFSDSFRGSAFIRAENNTDGLTSRTRKVRELKMSGIFFL